MHSPSGLCAGKRRRPGKPLARRPAMASGWPATCAEHRLRGAVNDRDDYVLRHSGVFFLASCRAMASAAPATYVQISAQPRLQSARLLVRLSSRLALDLCDIKPINASDKVSPGAVFACTQTSAVNKLAEIPSSLRDVGFSQRRDIIAADYPMNRPAASAVDYDQLSHRRNAKRSLSSERASLNHPEGCEWNQIGTFRLVSSSDIILSAIERQEVEELSINMSPRKSASCLTLKDTYDLSERIEQLLVFLEWDNFAYTAGLTLESDNPLGVNSTSPSTITISAELVATIVAIIAFVVALIGLLARWCTHRKIKGHPARVPQTLPRTSGWIIMDDTTQ